MTLTETGARSAPRADGDRRRHRHARRRPVRRAWRLLLQVVSWTVIVAITAALVIAVLLPRLGGATPYTILTGSMRPRMPPGTLVVAKPVDPADIAIGTVITYQLVSGKPDVVTHRVVAVSQDAHGRPIWQTQGDANPVPDLRWVRPVQVKGRLWYAVPYLGRVNLVLTGHQRHRVAIAVALGLGGYALAMWGGVVRDRVRRRRRVAR
ncbi:MAG: signal peptidase [Marmoricola sp.]|nr:signal peptidase [Marmoricola sp.]